MSPNLEHFPNEVFETIVGMLALSDLCTLRLCNRTLATKTSQDHFKSYFRSKHIDVTGGSLQALVNATQPGKLGCLIQHLVLVGVVNNTKALEAILAEKYSSEEESESEEQAEKEAQAERDLQILEQRQADYQELHESGTDVSLLSEAFNNISTNSKTGKLLSLSLEVVVYREDAERRLHPLAGGGWRFIWKSAADTYHTTMRALAASKLPIEMLNIFNDRRLQRCSLGCNELSRTDFKDAGLAISLASLKSLSVSLSDRIIFLSIEDANRSCDPDEERDFDTPDHNRDRDEIQSEKEDETNFIGLAKLLQLCSQLENLELHHYRLRSGVGAPDLHLERLLQRAAKAETLPRLKRLELRGVYVTEQDLLEFVQRTGVRKIFMHWVIMYGGRFRSIFDYCTSDTAGIEELHFHKLLEGGSLFLFEGLGASQSEPALIGADPGPRGNTLHREGEEVKKQITYGFGGWGVPELSSPQQMERIRQVHREYGPPNKGVA